MSNLRITGIETHVFETPRKPLVFARLQTNSDLTGLTEVPIRPDREDVLPLWESMAEAVIGTDPYETGRRFEGSGLFRAGPNNRLATVIRGALDIACWDIKGKHSGMPIYELLGGSLHGDSLRAYANGWYTECGMVTDEYQNGPRDHAVLTERAERVVEMGYDALKINPFGPAGHQASREELEHSVGVIGAIRAAVGRGVEIFIEGHQQFTPSKAVEVAEMLTPHDIGFFEEPTPPNTAALASLAANISIPVATGETLPTHGAFAELLTNTGISVLQPDAIAVGGVTELKKVATLAEAQGVSFAPHNSNGPISTAIAAHVGATAPTFLIQETFTEFVPPEWIDELFVEPLRVENGRLHLPDRPGLGLAFDVDGVHEYETDVRYIEQQ